MIKLRTPEYTFHIFCQNTETEEIVHQFLFVFQGDYYSHSLFISERTGPEGMKELIYSFTYTRELHPDQVHTTKETIGAALWYRYNKDYNIQDNIDMILDDDERVQKITLDNIIQEKKLNIKKKGGIKWKIVHLEYMWYSLYVFALYHNLYQLIM